MPSEWARRTHNKGLRELKVLVPEELILRMYAKRMKDRITMSRQATEALAAYLKVEHDI